MTAKCLGRRPLRIVTYCILAEPPLGTLLDESSRYLFGLRCGPYLSQQQESELGYCQYRLDSPVYLLAERVQDRGYVVEELCQNLPRTLNKQSREVDPKQVTVKQVDRYGSRSSEACDNSEEHATSG